MGKDIRLTRKSYAWETGKKVIVIIGIVRGLTWGYRRIKPIAYHPIALVGLTITTASYAISPWVTSTLCWAVVMWALIHPDSYLRHVNPRCQSFLAGFRYRSMPRRKLGGCSVLRDKDPIPTISWVKKHGCITTIRIKMAYGHEINWWREEAARLAPAYEALDVKINPYRREVLNPFKHEMVTKPRWLVLDFLTKDPFNSQLGVEFLSFHAAETLSPVVAVLRDGSSHIDDLAANRLQVARSRWGKSSSRRARIVAHRRNIRDGLLEVWLIDGKGGIEGAFLEGQVARWAYGDVDADPEGYDPSGFDQLLQDAVTVMIKRQKKMRGFATEHIPTPTEPWLLVMIDELLVLVSKNVPGEMRNRIAANINLIMQQGIALGVTIDAASQLGTKDNLDPINRAGFTEIEIGKVEPGVVDMLFGKGWEGRGARADEIAEDLKGVFYRRGEATTVPEQIRYPYITIADLNTMPKARESVLWVPPIHTPVEPQWANPPDQPLETMPEIVAAVTPPPQSRPKELSRPGPSFGGMR